MEITQENFESQLPDALKAISTCDFLAFDCEFSGFGLGGLAILPYDTPTLVYDKTKTNISNYTVMQFGLATFSYDPPAKKFRYRAFNFYVFPRLPKAMQRLRACVSDQFTFSAQADCMDFLASQNFDFNKWIAQGVGYLREAELTKLTDELKRRYTWRMKSGQPGADDATSTTGKNDYKIPDHAAARIADVMKTVKEFVENPGQVEMVLGDINMHERRMLFQIIEKEYPTSLFAHGLNRDDGATDIFLRKCQNAEDHDRMQQEKLTAELKELENAAGFCKVIKAITESRKPILGHNLFHDLLHVIRAFCCPLPDTFDQFKMLIQTRFKKIIDTKVLAGHPPLKTVAGSGMSLSDLYRKVTKPPFVQVVVEPESPEFGYSLSKGNLHEAGYDAYVTGVIFIHLANCLGDQKTPTRPTRDVPWELMRSLMGKITPGRIIDLPWLSLGTPDLVPDRRHVFHMTFTDGSRAWTNREIIPLFSPFGQVFINWIDERSAFVSLKTRELAPFVSKAMIQDQTAGMESGWRLRLATDFLQEMEHQLSVRLNSDSKQQAQHSADATDEPMDENGALKRVRCS